jgi:hypothetical protein
MTRRIFSALLLIMMVALSALFLVSLTPEIEIGGNAHGLGSIPNYFGTIQSSNTTSSATTQSGSSIYYGFSNYGIWNSSVVGRYNVTYLSSLFPANKPTIEVILPPVSSATIASSALKHYADAGFPLLGVIFKTSFSGNLTSLSIWHDTMLKDVNEYPFIHIWEIWTEPQNYFDGLLSQTLWYQNMTGYAWNYFQILKDSYNTIKAHNSTDTVLAFGGLPLDGYYVNQTLSGSYYNFSKPAELNSGPTGLAYISLIKFGGINYCDGIALHPYAAGRHTQGLPISMLLNQTITPIGVTYASLWAYGLQSFWNTFQKPLWITETGSPNNVPGASPAYQGAYMSQQIVFFSSFPYVKSDMWYEGFGANNSDFNFIDYNPGAFHHNYTLQPAFYYFSDSLNQSTLKSSDTGGQILLLLVIANSGLGALLMWFQKNGEKSIFFWGTFPEKKRHTLSLSPRLCCASPRKN